LAEEEVEGVSEEGVCVKNRLSMVAMKGLWKNKNISRKRI
jgi:hypothetical protein